MNENQHSAGLRSYVVPYDSGFAPNPFHGFCTLATCKPRIRKGARVGDWIVGVGSKQNGLGGHLVYAMKVQEEMTFDEYFNDPRFQDKKPNLQGNREQRCGDNIYCRDGDSWNQLKSYHGPGDIEHDTQTDRVLISRDYVYFGRGGPEIPKDITSSGKWVCHEGRGHRKFDGRNPSDAKMIAKFEKWIRSLGKTGVAGVPIDWGDTEDDSGHEEKNDQCGGGCDKGERVALYSYIVTRDNGDEPKLFQDFCALATCKPEVRQQARIGDWVIGCGPKEHRMQNHLVYAMKVSEILSSEKYTADPRFAGEKPVSMDSGDKKGGCGSGGCIPKPENRVLISDDYVYFGRKAPSIPEHIAFFGRSICRPGRPLCHTDEQGHLRFDSRKQSDKALITEFENWLRSLGVEGKVGEPIEWDKEE